MPHWNDELAIRARRGAFNKALAERDLAAIRAVLAPDVVMVTGSDSAVLAGVSAQLNAWKSEFAAKLRMLYVRHTGSIVLSNVLPIAFEQGSWEGVAAGAEVAVASGLYTAKWRKFGSDWLIEAEVFFTRD